MASCNNGFFIEAKYYSTSHNLIKTASNTRMSIIMMMKALLLAVCLILIGPSLAAAQEDVQNKQKPDTRKEIHLAGIFPINGVEGWQGGQVISISMYHSSKHSLLPRYTKSVKYHNTMTLQHKCQYHDTINTAFIKKNMNIFFNT